MDAVLAQLELSEDTEPPNEKNASIILTCRQVSLWGIILINDRSGRVQATMVGSTPGQVVLGATILKSAEQAIRGKPVSSIPP